MSALFIHGGRVIDPATGLDGPHDVLAVDGRIEAVDLAGAISAPADAAVIDASGWWVVPGLVDPHVHLRDPGFPQKETIESGLRAAAAGGFTAVAAMANTSPVNDTPEVTRYMLDCARKVRSARLIPVSAVTKGLGGVELVDFDAMVEAGARLFSDDGIPIDDQVLLREAFDRLSSLGFAVSLHEEDRELSAGGAVNAGEVSKRLGVKGVPPSAETRMIRRDLALAMGAEAAVHVAHLSCAESVQMVRAARRTGTRVTCEVTPHHFALDETAVLRFGPNAKMNPPLRSRRDVEALREAMGDGTIDMIATDHAPHDPASKNLEKLAGCFAADAGAKQLSEEEARTLTCATNGVVGLETSVGLALGLVREGVITAPRMIEMMSLNPAKLLRLEAEGMSAKSRADITIIDPDIEWTVDPARFLSKSRNTPFAGMRLRGKAAMTIVGGEVVYDQRHGTIS